MSLAVEAVGGAVRIQPQILYLLHDIDGATRQTKPWVFPFWTTASLYFGINIRPTEEQVRKMIALGSRTPKKKENWFSDLTELHTPKELWEIWRHQGRPLIENVGESIAAIKKVGMEGGRSVRWGNLSGRKPHLHDETYYTQKTELADFFDINDLDLNPGVGTYNWKVFGAYSRLTGKGRFEGQAGNVVMVEDDERAIQTMDALNELNEVKLATTKLLIYRKRNSIWNSDLMLIGADINPESETVVSFDDFAWMAQDCVRRIRAGLI